MAESARRFLRTDFRSATLGVRADNAPMLRLFDQRVRPFVPAVTASWAADKRLTPG